MQRSIK